LPPFSYIQGDFTGDAFFAQHDLNGDKVLDKDEVMLLYTSMASSLDLPQGVDAAPLIQMVRKDRLKRRTKKRRNCNSEECSEVAESYQERAGARAQSELKGQRRRTAVGVCQQKSRERAREVEKIQRMTPWLLLDETGSDLFVFYGLNAHTREEEMERKEEKERHGG
jgi:hypothetical protein